MLGCLGGRGFTSGAGGLATPDVGGPDLRPLVREPRVSCPLDRPETATRGSRQLLSAGAHGHRPKHPHRTGTPSPRAVCSVPNCRITAGPPGLTADLPRRYGHSLWGFGALRSAERSALMNRSPEACFTLVFENRRQRTRTVVPHDPSIRACACAGPSTTVTHFHSRPPDYPQAVPKRSCTSVSR